MIDRNIIIRVADFNIGIEFYKETRTYVQNVFTKMFCKKCKNFLIEGKSMLDFTIRIKSTDNIANIIKNEKNRVKKYFYLNFVIDEINRIAYTTYYLSEVQLDILIKTVLHEVLRKNNGFFTHGSAVYHKNQALIFIGKSGTGKSTIAKMLSTNMPILADDIFIIRKIKNIFYFFQTPFLETNWYYQRTNKKYCISNFIFLSQGDKNQIKKENNQSYIYLRLLEQIIFEKKIVTKNQLELLNTLITSCNFYTLKFNLQRKTVTKIINRFLK